MRALKHTLLASGLLGLCAASFAQPPEESRSPRGEESRPRPEAREREESRDQRSFIERLMARDSNGDKKLTKEELLDARLARLFDRADANNDGFVTAEELSALERSEEEIFGRGRPEGRGPDGVGPREGGPPREGARPPREEDRPRPEGDRPPRDGDRPDGERGPRDGDRERSPRDGERPPRGERPEGPRGFGPPGGSPFGMRGAGMILPPPLMDELDLTEDQREKIRELQRDVQAKLQNILTEDQRAKMREMRERGPGGPGPRGFEPEEPRRDGDRPEDRERPRDGGEQDRPRPERDRN